MYATKCVLTLYLLPNAQVHLKYRLLVLCAIDVIIDDLCHNAQIPAKVPMFSITTHKCTNTENST